MNGAKIFVLGVAYKKNISDMRESPALKVIQGLLKHGALFSYNDPYVESVIISDKIFYSAELNEKKLKEADLVLILTDHSQYNPEFIAEHSLEVFDTRNITKNIKKRMWRNYENSRTKS